MNMTNQLMGLLFSVILVVLGAEFGDEIINSAAGVLNSAYIDDFLGLDIAAQILPTVYYIGLVGFAGSIAFFSARGLSRGVGGGGGGRGGGGGGGSR